MTSLTLKNIPEDIHQRLRERAARHHRSLSSEVLACLEAVLSTERADRNALLDLARRTRARVRGRLTDRLLAELKAEGRR